MKFLNLITILCLSFLTSCKNEQADDTTIHQQSEDPTLNPIRVVRRDDNRSEESEIFSFIARLEDPVKMSSDEDTAILVNENSGQRYEVPFFSEILGVRSINESHYEVKLYKDNTLYGINPVYEEIQSPLEYPD